MPTEFPAVVGDNLENPATPVAEPNEPIETPEPGFEANPEPINPDPAANPDPAKPAEPAAPFSLTKEQWEAHQAEVRDMKTWKAEQEKIRAEQQTREQSNTPRREWSDQEWERAEKDFGYSTVKQTDAEGNVKDVLHVDRRQNIKGTMNLVSRAMEIIKGEIMQEMENHTANSRMDSTISELEHRKENPLVDIRQHLPKMKEYLAKWHDEKDYANPEVQEAAYRWAKGWAAPTAAARAVAGQNEKGRVIHPASPKPAANPGNNDITPLEREMMAGIDEKTWLAARGRR